MAFYCLIYRLRTSYFYNMQYTMYAVHNVCRTQCIQHTLLTVHCIGIQTACSTQRNIMIIDQGYSFYRNRKNNLINIFEKSCFIRQFGIASVNSAQH